MLLIALPCLSAPVWAQPPVPVTVKFSVIEIFENVCAEDFGEVCPNDLYLRVNIGSNIPGNDFIRHDFPDKAGTLRPARFSTERVMISPRWPVRI